MERSLREEIDMRASQAEGKRRAVLVTMRSMLPNLRPSERRIAERFLADPEGTAVHPITGVAELCGTSTTSVVRFCHRFGYDHFNDLRMDVLKEVTRDSLGMAHVTDVTGDINQEDTLDDIVAKISQAEVLSIVDTAKMLNIDSLGEAVQAVSDAERVGIFGVGASAFVAMDFQQKLNRIGRTALSWSDTHAAWTAATLLRPGDAAIAVSYSGETKDTIDFLNIAREAGATAIAATNHLAAPLATSADIILTTAARETGFRSGALGSRIAQLMVMDCLFIGVAQARYEESMSAIRQTYATIRRLAKRA